LTIVAGQIGNGETKEFPVTPGHHQLRMKIDWCGSKPVEFRVSEKEVLAFEAKSNLCGTSLLLALWFVVFAWNSYIVLEPAERPPSRRW
jgi:hypothetical protein